MNRSRYLGRARRLARRQTQWVRDTALDPTPELSAALNAFAAEAEPAGRTSRHGKTIRPPERGCDTAAGAGRAVARAR